MSLFLYWNRLRAGRRAPLRHEIEPADIKTLLADTFILERDGRGEAVFRLAGTRLCAIFGRELKGFAFASLWTERDRRVVSRLIDRAFIDKTVIVISFRGISRSGRQNPLELTVLPLDGGTTHPRILGSLVPLEKPFWLGADPIVASHVETLRIVDPDREPVFLANRPAIPVPPLAPDQQDLAGGKSRRRVRHLVVIDGGRDR